MLRSVRENSVYVSMSEGVSIDCRSETATDASLKIIISFELRDCIVGYSDVFVIYQLFTPLSYYVRVCMSVCVCVSIPLSVHQFPLVNTRFDIA